MEHLPGLDDIELDVEDLLETRSTCPSQCHLRVVSSIHPLCYDSSGGADGGKDSVNIGFRVRVSPTFPTALALQVRSKQFLRMHSTCVSSARCLGSKLIVREAVQDNAQGRGVF